MAALMTASLATAPPPGTAEGDGRGPSRPPAEGFPTEVPERKGTGSMAVRVPAAAAGRMPGCAVFMVRSVGTRCFGSGRSVAGR